MATPREQLSEIMADGVITDEELEYLTKEDLRDMILKVNDEVIEKDKEITDLTKELTRKANRGKGIDDEGDVYSTQLAQLSDRLISVEQERDTYREELADAKARYENILSEKNQVDIQLKTSRKALEDAEKELQNITEANRQNLRKSQEVSKQKKESQSEHIRLFEENERLQEENLLLNKQLESTVSSKVELEGLLLEMNEHKEQFEAKHDAMLGGHQDLSTQISELERTLANLTDQHSRVLEEHGTLETEMTSLKVKYQTDMSKAKEELAKQLKETEEVKQQIRSLKTSTQTGQLQTKIDQLTSERNQAVDEAETLAEEINALENDKKILAAKLLEYEVSLGDKVYERVAQEKESNRLLHTKLQSQAQMLKEETERFRQMEIAIDKLVREKDELEQWKNIYERGHGIQELSKHQKKMKEENRKVGIAMDQVTRRLSEAMDTNAYLFQAFEKLKSECGKPKDFMYSEYVLQEEMLGENARIKAQLREVENQVDSLESETARLRKALKNQVGVVGEHGFQYQNMTADMLVKVNEFAANLRDGKTDFPLDDRSTTLLKENKQLRDDIKSFELKIDRYEKEHGLRKGKADAVVPNHEGDIVGLREDLQKMLKENLDTKQRMALMQDEITILLKQYLGNAEGQAGAVHSVMAENTERLVRELQDLRSTKVIQTLSSDTRLLAEHASSTQRRPPGASGRPPTAGAMNVSVADWTPLSRQRSDSNTSDPKHQTLYDDLNQTFRPATPHGKQLLNKTLAQLNLPPAEWAEEVKELNAQLIECLEQLYEREGELEEMKDVVITLEDKLIAIKQQMATVYHDYSQRSETWESRENHFKSEAATLLHERDDLKLKLKRTQELITLAGKDDPDAIENKIKELGRKVLVYEVNEAVLSRKYTSIEEQLQNERQIRETLECDMAEMETTLKKRILYLEQYKLATGSKIGRMQGRLDLSVPIDDFHALEKELANLREDHLSALSREVDAKISTLNAQEKARELRALKLVVTHLKVDLTESHAMNSNLALQLEHQKEATLKALTAANSSAELSALVSEMARFRGEASRLEVELIASKKRCDLLTEQGSQMSKEIESGHKQLARLQESEDQLVAKEAESRREFLALELKYNGGIEREEAEELKNRLEHLSKDYEQANRDAERYKEMADIASQQAQMLSSIKTQRNDEMKVLSDHCAALEMRGDDDILIGRLQRQLIAVKTSYKAFTRKYQTLRANMRQRELAQRVIETSLDQREEAIHTLQETHRFEVSALKRAIRSITDLNEDEKVVSEDLFDKASLKGLNKEQEINMRLKMRQTATYVAGVIKIKTKGKSKNKLLTNSQKLLQLSEKVGTLSELAEDSLKMTWEYEEKNRILQGDLQDGQAERDILLQRCQDLESTLETNGKSKQQVLASRLVSLSEDVRTNKLITLQQRRQISVLRQEKRHLQALLTAMESDVEHLEEGQILAETKGLLDVRVNKNLDDSDDLTAIEIERIKDMPTMSPEDMYVSKPIVIKPNLKIITSDFVDDDLDGPSPNETFALKLEDMAEQLAVHRREASNKKMEADKFSRRVYELEQILSEKDNQINYYESVMVREGLVSLNYDPNNQRTPHSSKRSDRSTAVLLRQEQERMQEAASATIGSLKNLLEEKNKTIDKYRRKIDDLTSQSHKKSYVDKKAEDLLKQLEIDENKRTDTHVDAPSRGGPDEKGYKRLLSQVEAADDIIADKDKTIIQLEQRLMTQSNQRERAEIRCGAAINEMDSMKSDMLTLVQQLKDAEERCTELSKPQGSMRQDGGLEIRIKAKDEKLKKYRDIIVKLKDEFIKSEEDQAIKISAMKDRGPQTSTNVSASLNVSSRELEELRSQVIALREGLKQAKEDLENARKNREKLSKAREASLEEVDRLESQLGRVEAQASAAQEALQRCRKELDDSKKKEVRLRDKLKDLLEADSNVIHKDRSNKEAAAKIDQLEREAAILRAQNIALRKTSEETVDRKRQDELDGIPSKLAPTSTSPPRQSMAGKGYILGSATDNPDGNKDELREQKREQWETEKKLQRRVVQLENRLKERMDEIDELQVQLKKSKETILQANVAKDELLKKVSAKSSETKKALSSHSSVEAVATDIESYRAKVFELEESMQSLRRRAEVELPGELSILRHQVSVSKARVDELEVQLRESEERRRKESNATLNGGENRSLRDSEDRFMREERLKDDIDHARRQRLDLEAAILERDSRAMEHRFDLEARTSENERLRRRLHELEAIVKSTPGTTKRTAWEEVSSRPGTSGGSKKEKELEGVIDAMKRVIDKLKAENERMKKTGGPDERKATDAEKRATNEKKRADKLEEDISVLQAKLKATDKGTQELAQKQTAMIALRKTLKIKEDEISQIKSLVADSEEEKSDLQRKLKSSEERLESLEDQLASKSTNATTGNDGLIEKLTQQTADLQILRSELENTRKEMAAVKRVSPAPLTGGDGSAEILRVKNINKQLNEENEKLKQELSAFDLDFFEEIENLKFAHAEAMRKLRVYEGRSA